MLLAAVVLLWCAAFVAGLVQGARDEIHLPAPPPLAITPAAVVSREPQSRIVPTVFPYSVVAGGVRSPGEARAAMRRDAVVAAHYVDFRVADARLVTLPAARRVHVSYRIGDRVYWTRRTVAMSAGEAVLTDGTHEIRARCGNRVADEVLGETSDAEPSEEVLDLPILVSRDLEPEPIPSRSFAPMPFGLTASPGYAPRGTAQPQPRARVPEPGILALLALGVATLAARAHRQKT